MPPGCCFPSSLQEAEVRGLTGFLHLKRLFSQLGLKNWQCIAITSERPNEAWASADMSGRHPMLDQTSLFSEAARRMPPIRDPGEKMCANVSAWTSATSTWNWPAQNGAFPWMCDRLDGAAQVQSLGCGSTRQQGNTNGDILACTDCGNRAGI